jgi:hypothetical protein
MSLPAVKRHRDVFDKFKPAKQTDDMSIFCRKPMNVTEYGKAYKMHKLMEKKSGL